MANGISPTVRIWNNLKLTVQSSYNKMIEYDKYLQTHQRDIGVDEIQNFIRVLQGDLNNVQNQLPSLNTPTMTQPNNIQSESKEYKNIKLSEKQLHRIIKESVKRILKEAEKQEEINTIGQKYVDLGLPSGLKWATCNVGAKTPTEFGNYFRWSEVTDAREMGNVATYNEYGKPFKDTATYHMGGAWRMPTKKDFQELCDNTTSEWICVNGVNGRLFTSKVNGEQLFFPAAGYCNDDSVEDVGSNGHVWASNLYSGFPGNAWSLNLSSGNVNISNYYSYRYYGFSVRAVHE